MDKAARAELTKATSINLCPSVNGQICMAMVMWPPKVSRWAPRRHAPLGYLALQALCSGLGVLVSIIHPCSQSWVSHGEKEGDKGSGAVHCIQRCPLPWAACGSRHCAATGFIARLSAPGKALVRPSSCKARSGLRVGCHAALMCLQEGEPSYELYRKERDGLLSSLKRRAKMLEHVLNELEGVSCTKVRAEQASMPLIRRGVRALSCSHVSLCLWCNTYITGRVLSRGQP